ncbi:MAG: hypothetical protein J0M10_06885 [Chitinophagales bacterium]|nr:hypothetical protein [Chitinophagales bacterium]
MNRIVSLLSLLLLSAQTTTGQFPGIDRARNNIYKAATDKERLISIQAAAAFKNSMPGDSILHYARWAKELALKLGNDKALARAEYSLLSGEVSSGGTDSVISHIETNIIFRNIKKTDPELYYKVQLLKANVLNRSSRLSEALELQLKLLADAEKENNTLARLFLINYTGATYLNTSGHRETAKKMWESGLEIIRESPNPAYQEIETYLLSNLSLYYLGNFYLSPSTALRDSCFKLLNHTIDLCRKTESMGVLASTFSYRANLYGRLKMYPEAEADFRETISLRSKIGDPLYISEDLKNMALFFYERKEMEKCLATVDEGLLLCEKFHIRETLIEFLKLKAGVFRIKGDQPRYTEMLEIILRVADSAYRINTAEKMASLQTQYEVQKKEALIARQKLDLFQQNLLLYASGAVALVLALFFIHRFRIYRKRQLQLLEEKRKQHEINIKEAEEKERKRIAAELHDNLGVQANAILYNSSQLDAGTEKQQLLVTDLQETAKEMLLNLRETLWALKNTDISAMDLWFRVINFMQQMGRHYTHIQFSVLGNPPKEFILTANRALHLVLVIQETVNNSVKHAEAANITIQSVTKEHEWEITVMDNGKGFDIKTARAKTESYGLGNMEERAVAGRFTLDIKSGPDTGTYTCLRIQP